MQEQFGDNFDEKVVSWTEQTKETELNIRLLEEVTTKGVQMSQGEDEALFNFSVEAVRDLPSFDEPRHKRCLSLLHEISGQGKMEDHLQYDHV